MLFPRSAIFPYYISPSVFFFFIFYNVVHKLSVPAALLAVKLKKFDFSAFSGYLVVIVHCKIV